MQQTIQPLTSSYRDPSGFMFEKDGILYRHVNKNFKEDFDLFISSGCYNHLVKKQLLITHAEQAENISGFDDWYKTLQPDKIPFISYPYEWCFDMLKDAALLTLQLAKEALQFNMILKDATPYNIQWHKGKLIFIDTLSFQKFEELPWIAYRQFCENFLGPLLIMHYSKKQLPELMLAWPNGIPLAIIRSLLPKKSRFSLYTYLHIHLHTKYSYKNQKENVSVRSFSKQKLLNLLSSLEALVFRLKIPVQKSAWLEYYEEASQRNDYLEQKKKIIESWINEMGDIKTAADLGANEGEFSKLLSHKNIYTIAADFDSYCINNLYQEIKSVNEKNIQPLVLDLSNPSPAAGVNNEERKSFFARTKTDLVLVLALIHHLAIGKNIPFEMLADMLQRIGQNLIIEFVPKEDKKIQWMLKHKKDIYADYTKERFEQAFLKYFFIQSKQPIGNSGRFLYLVKGK